MLFVIFELDLEECAEFNQIKKRDGLSRSNCTCNGTGTWKNIVPFPEHVFIHSLANSHVHSTNTYLASTMH